MIGLSRSLPGRSVLLHSSHALERHKRFGLENIRFKLRPGPYFALAVLMRDTEPYDYDGIEAGVAQRLKRVCADMPPEEFEELVRTAALIQWKYEQQRDREARILFNIAADNARYAEGQ